MASSIESAAQMSIGQAFLKVVDKMLWIVEKSVQWSLPTQDPTAGIYFNFQFYMSKRWTKFCDKKMYTV